MRYESPELIEAFSDWMPCDELERKRTGDALIGAVRIFFAKLAQGANLESATRDR